MFGPRPCRLQKHVGHSIVVMVHFTRASKKAPGHSTVLHREQKQKQKPTLALHTCQALPHLLDALHADQPPQHQIDKNCSCCCQACTSPTFEAALYRHPPIIWRRCHRARRIALCSRHYGALVRNLTMQPCILVRQLLCPAICGSLGPCVHVQPPWPLPAGGRRRLRPCIGRRGRPRQGVSRNTSTAFPGNGECYYSSGAARHAHRTAAW